MAEGRDAKPRTAQNTRAAAAAFGLLGACAFALALRARSALFVFGNPEGVVLRADDSQYHARRALYTLEHFPSALDFDPYLAFPHGARVPWPPLWDWLLAALPRGFGVEAADLPSWLAWSSALAGSLTLFAVHAAARALGGRAEALGAALLFAIFPVALNYGSVGNADHHAFVVLCATVLLACDLHLLRAESPARCSALAALAALARAALFASWQGALLHLALELPAFLVCCALGPAAPRLVAQGFSLLASAALIAPIALTESAPPASLLELSSFQVRVLALAGLVCLALSLWHRQRPPAAALRALLRPATLALLAAAALLASGGLPAGWESALDYGSRSEGWMAGNFESQPLFGHGSAQVGRRLFDHWIWLLPLVPLAGAARARGALLQRQSALFFGLWSAALLLLALSSARYAHDLAPAAAIGFAWLLGAAVQRARRAPRVAPALALGLAVLLSAPGLLRIARGLPYFVRWDALDTATGLRPASFQRDALRFALAVREATPPTAGWRDARSGAEYGLLCFPTLGTLLVNAAQRPVSASGFGPYLGDPSYRATLRFYALGDEVAAWQLARELRARYVVTSREGRPPATSLLHRLHELDGSVGPAAPALQRFRLVTEAPALGYPLAYLSGQTSQRIAAPYKLFEVVEGARLEVAGETGETVRIALDLRTPTGRRLRYRNALRIGSEQPLELRLPYSTEASTPVRAEGSYRIRIGARSHTLEVPERAVQDGARIGALR